MKFRAIHRNISVTLIFLFSLVWFGYIGRYRTLYGAGIMLVPVVFALGLIPFFASAFLFVKSWPFSIRVYLLSCTVLFSTLVVVHYIGNYKPTIYLQIPENYEGCVFLFQEKSESLEDVKITEQGIAYIPWGGHYHLKVKLGDKKRSDLLNSGNYNQIRFYNADSSRIHWVDVSCLEVSSTIDYEKDHYVNRAYNPCMEGRELRMLMRLGIVDSSRIHWIFYNYDTLKYFEP